MRYNVGMAAHRIQIDFNSSERSSLGVEMELALVDKETRELKSGAIEILADMGADHPDGEHPKAKHELLQSTVEIITGICSTAAEARQDLAATLAELQPQAEDRNLDLICAGTHPFSDWAKQEISPKERYQRLVDLYQWPARRLQIFGIHVHVGVRSAAKAISIGNALCAYIPHFLALSASSPYWVGEDTGMASVRSKVFEALPTAGLPYELEGWPEFEEFMGTLIAAKAITSIREVWWDIRPHPSFGTIELRICDGIPTLQEVSAVAALTQCLVEWLDRLVDRGYTLPTPRTWVTRENKWRAARWGLDAEIIVDDGYRLQPVRSAIRELIGELTPVADRLGCTDELAGCLKILDHGASYARQREVMRRGGRLVDVVEQLVEELRTDQPSTVFASDAFPRSGDSPA
jgi:glutamate---cysteine ligase / carboxylate-amine ligase